VQYNEKMLSVTVIDNDGKKKEITINQKHLCSFHLKIIDQKEVTEVRMSNGDIWHVIEPPYSHWFPDTHTTSQEY